jgi:hypothetical protein
VCRHELVDRRDERNTFSFVGTLPQWFGRKPFRIETESTNGVPPRVKGGTARALSISDACMPYLDLMIPAEFCPKVSGGVAS